MAFYRNSLKLSPSATVLSHVLYQTESQLSQSPTNEVLQWNRHYLSLTSVMRGSVTARLGFRVPTVSQILLVTLTVVECMLE